MSPAKRINLIDWSLKIDPPVRIAAEFERKNIPVDDLTKWAGVVFIVLKNPFHENLKRSDKDTKNTLEKIVLNVL